MNFKVHFLQQFLIDLEIINDYARLEMNFLKGPPTGLRGGKFHAKSFGPAIFPFCSPLPHDQSLTQLVAFTAISQNGLGPLPIL